MFNIFLCCYWTCLVCVNFWLSTRECLQCVLFYSWHHCNSKKREKNHLSSCLLIFVKKLGSILQTNCLGKGLCWIKLSTEEGQRKIDSFVGNWRVLIYKSTTSPLSFMHQSCLNRLETFIIISKHSQNCAVLWSSTMYRHKKVVVR